MRPVPRNIDRPNRMAELVVAALTVYYGTMFMFHEPLFSIFMAGVTWYTINKITQDKPEGMAYRLWYKFFGGFGRMMPNPNKTRKFEI